MSVLLDDAAKAASLAATLRTVETATDEEERSGSGEWLVAAHLVNARGGKSRVGNKEAH